MICLSLRLIIKACSSRPVWIDKLSLEVEVASLQTSLAPMHRWPMPERVWSEDRWFGGLVELSARPACIGPGSSKGRTLISAKWSVTLILVARWVGPSSFWLFQRSQKCVLRLHCTKSSALLRVTLRTPRNAADDANDRANLDLKKERDVRLSDELRCKGQLCVSECNG